MEETQLSQDFKAAVVRWLNEKGYDVTEITSWDEDYDSYGGCPTCGPGTTIYVDIYYKDTSGRSGHYTYDGSFSDILTEILNG